jgi:putative ABC exporter
VILAGVARSRLRMARAFLFTRGGARRIRGMGWLAIFGPLALGTFFFWAAGQLFTEVDALGLEVEHAGAALALVFMSAVAALWIADLHHVVTSLLLDSDLELLLRAPLTRTQLLLLKLADSVPRTTPAILVIALPFAVAFGVIYRAPVWAWALLPLQLAALWATPIGLGVTGGLLLGRVIPSRRARETLALFSTLTLMALWLGNAVLMPRLANMSQHGLRAVLTPPLWLIATSPPHWAARAMVAAARGEPAEALGWTAVLLLAGAGSLALAAGAAQAWLAEALARSSSDPRAKRARSGGRLPETAGRALVVKDARLLLRDWPVLADVVTASVLWTALPLLFPPIRQGPALLTGRTMLVAMAVALGYEVGCRSVPFERAGLAWSRLAPIAPRRWNAIKLAGATVISLPLLLVAAAAIRVALPLHWGEWFALLSAGLSALFLALVVGLWTGWTFAEASWTNPRAMLSLTGRWVATILLLLQGAMWLAALAILDLMAGVAPAGVLWWGPPAAAALGSLPMMEAAISSMKRCERF